MWNMHGVCNRVAWFDVVHSIELYRIALRGILNGVFCSLVFYPAPFCTARQNEIHCVTPLGCIIYHPMIWADACLLRRYNLLKNKINMMQSKVVCLCVKSICQFVCIFKRVNFSLCWIVGYTNTFSICIIRNDKLHNKRFTFICLY